MVQWHGAAALESDFERIRRELGAQLWRVIRVGPSGLRRQRLTFTESDGVLLDTFVKGALGGTGRTFDWKAVAADVRKRREGLRLIVAGGVSAAGKKLDAKGLREAFAFTRKVYAAMKAEERLVVRPELAAEKLAGLV